MQALRQRRARFMQTSAASNPTVSYQQAAKGQDTSGPLHHITSRPWPFCNAYMCTLG